METGSRIYIAGHKGLVGSAILRRLERDGFGNIITRTSRELDLREKADAERFFKEEQPEYIFLAAAKVGGILANESYPAEFIFDNIAIQSNVIYLAQCYHVKKLLFLGSSCIYPKFAPQPLKEEYLLTGALEPTNAPYAVAKIAGITLCQAFNRQYGTNFISAMPANLYGPGDHFDPDYSHVLPAIIRKMHEAKVNSQPYVQIWGTGDPRREFLYVDDLADACLFLMLHYHDSEIINIGTGKDISIAELSFLIKEIVGYTGGIVYDSAKPDGTPRKLLNIEKLSRLGWKPRYNLDRGIRETYRWFLQNKT